MATDTPEEVLQRMQQASNTFYDMAVRCHVHQFVEFAGCMNEFIKILRDMHEAGIDFQSNEPRPKSHQMAYIAEKLDCIYGAGATADPAALAAFVSALRAKGWPIKLESDRG